MPSVANRHPEGSAVVVVVVIVDRKDQTTIHRHARRQVAADQIRRTQAAVCVSDVGDERAHAGAGDRTCADSEPAAALTIRTNLTNASCRRRWFRLPKL